MSLCIGRSIHHSKLMSPRIWIFSSSSSSSSSSILLSLSELPCGVRAHVKIWSSSTKMGSNGSLWFYEAATRHSFNGSGHLKPSIYTSNPSTLHHKNYVVELTWIYDGGSLEVCGMSWEAKEVGFCVKMIGEHHEQLSLHSPMSFFLLLGIRAMNRQPAGAGRWSILSIVRWTHSHYTAAVHVYLLHWTIMPLVSLSKWGGGRPPCVQLLCHHSQHPSSTHLYR